MISVIIPTYKSSHVLDLCIKSALEGQSNKNEIIIVVDGTYEENKHILKKYENDVLVLNIPSNVGTCRATNMGVYNSTHDKILIVNDDNVFPKDWDKLLTEHMLENEVVSPNQIEPYPSMFKQFVIKDLGRNPDSFDLDSFWDYSEMTSSNHTMDDSGCTFPILMFKKDFLRVGGFDENYPSQAGAVADWDFFLKCELSGMRMLRDYSAHFYHFVSVSSKSADEMQVSKQSESDSHEYFKYKWGQYAQHDSNSNSKMISKYKRI
jgi:glycosyltransferase involved in cell wall biosynthesis